MVVLARARGYDRRRLLKRADAARTKRRHKKAISLYRQVLAAEPEDVDTHKKIAPLLARAKRRPEVLASYQKAVEGLVGQGFDDQAIGVLRAAAAQLPKEASLWHALAIRQREDARKVINVAASRARDQLWVVHSLDPGRDLKPGDLRLRLIAHAEGPSLLRPKRGEQEHRGYACELDKRIHVHLADAGYRLLQQYAVGEYVLDLVVEGANGRRAAIQCDGDRAFEPDALTDAMERQITLERLGWEFLRVRASEFYRAPERTLKKLERRLAGFGLRPLEEGATEAPSAAKDEPLDAKVRKRAEQIRARWKDVPTVSSVLGSGSANAEAIESADGSTIEDS